MYREGEQSFITWIKKRIKNNLNFVALAEGPTGIGKSWAMIQIGYTIDPEFEARQVAFSFKQVMEILNSEWFNKKKYKTIIFDESQITISNRAWQSLSNKLMNYLLSTFRHRNVILLFTSPYADFLDSQSMKLVHVIFEVKSHNNKNNKTTIRPKLLQYNSRLKKFYQHSLFVIKNKKTNKLINWKITKPPQHLIKPYEKAKMEFTEKLNRNILEELNNAEDKKLGDAEKKGELNPDSMQPLIWKIAKEGYEKQEDIAKELTKIKGKSVDIGQLNRNIMSMRKKGYDIRKFKLNILRN